MSRRGSCYDNAALERFWSTLKLAMIYRLALASHREARVEIFDYFDG